MVKHTSTKNWEIYLKRQKVWEQYFSKMLKHFQVQQLNQGNVKHEYMSITKKTENNSFGSGAYDKGSFANSC